MRPIQSTRLWFPIVASSLAVTALAACAEMPGEITRDTQPFGDVAETARITMLGTEPFWGLDIEPEADGQTFTARFSSASGDIDESAFAVTRFAGNNGLGFSGELGDRAVQVALTPGECSDGMSDRAYPYTATVSLGDATLFGCGYTSDEPFTGEESP